MIFLHNQAALHGIDTARVRGLIAAAWGHPCYQMDALKDALGGVGSWDFFQPIKCKPSSTTTKSHWRWSDYNPLSVVNDAYLSGQRTGSQRDWPAEGPSGWHSNSSH